MRTSIAVLTLVLVVCLVYFDIVEFPRVLQAHSSQENQRTKLAPNFWKDLNKARLGKKEDYIIENDTSIGAGTWSKVYKGIHVPTGDKVALKYSIGPQNNKKLQRELSILQTLEDAPNFLALRDLFKEQVNGEEGFVLVLDYFEKEKYKNVFNKLTKYKIKHFMYQTLKTLEYAHSKRIIHRDIKPYNVLINTRTLQVRVIDWGISDYFHPNKRFSSDIGTIPFQPPEMLLEYVHYNTSFDIWSTGCMFAEMMFQRKNFFRTKREKKDASLYTPQELRNFGYYELLDDIAQVLGTEDLLNYAEKIKDEINVDKLNFVGSYKRKPLMSFKNEKNAHLVDPLLVDLLEKIFVYEPGQRPTASEALGHPYFDEIRHLTFNNE